MSSAITVGAGDLLTQRSFLLFLFSRSLSRFASLVGIVAFGWQVYDLTNSAFALGMIGLAGFLPTALLVFVAGNAADRYERKRILQACQLVEALTTLLLAWGAYAGWLTVVDIFIAVLVLGTTAAFENPATAALLPQVVPRGTVQRATALSSGSAQLATITGPALGGIAYAISPALPYAIMVAFWLTAALCAGAVRLVASNNLGQFESGVTAALLGTVPAAVLGGVATVATALLWMKLFPTLRHVEKLE